MTGTDEPFRKVGAADDQRCDRPAAVPLDSAAAMAEIARLRRALDTAAARERALVDALHHRVRNMLAMIRSIARQTWEEGASQSEYAQHLQGRLDAIARYHRHFGVDTAEGFDLEDLVRDELLSTLVLDTRHCRISGPPVRLHGKQAELTGLAIHELTVNAIKFGALAQPAGVLAIAWSVVEGRLDFRWSESGVAIAGAAPRPFGFGRQLIEHALPYELGATTSFVLRAGGIACCIAFPLAETDVAVVRAEPAARSIAPAAGQSEATR